MMKLLSSTPLSPSQSPEADGLPTCHRAFANESYIAVALSDTTVHVVSSRTGALLQRRPFELPGPMANAFLIDGDTLIVAYFQGARLTLYHIPSE